MPMQNDRTPRSLWLFFGALAVASFSLNLLWELAQMRAYVEMAGQGWLDTLLTCTLASSATGAQAAADLCWGRASWWSVYGPHSLKTEGWVKKAFVGYTGQKVKKGDRSFKKLLRGLERG
jgi:hypothetical protein